MSFVANDDSNHCAQACIAMLTGSTLADVLVQAGDSQLQIQQTLDFLKNAGISVSVNTNSDGQIVFSGHRVTPISEFSANSTLLCRLHVVRVLNSDDPISTICRVGNHLVVIHGGMLFDPSLDRPYSIGDGLKKIEEFGLTPFFSLAFELHDIR